jgi:lipid-binding SYLF domain-containing protein
MNRQKFKSKSHKKWILVVVGVLAFAPTSFAKSRDSSRSRGDSKEANRLANASAAMHEILNIHEGIPRDLLAKARCVVVVPSVLKAAFVVGGSYGRGTMTCRTGKDFSGKWGPPSMVALEGGSVGLQIGGQATDYVFLIMNSRGARSLLHSKVKLGADASIAAGPVGRSAEADTDAYVRAEILSYSRARGIFAGVSLQGSTLRPDNKANRDLYGRSMSAQEIINGSEVKTPEAAHDLIALLDRTSPERKTS